MPKFQNREKAIKDGKFINTHHTQISKQRKSHETWKIYKHPSYPNLKTEKKKKTMKDGKFIYTHHTQISKQRRKKKAMKDGKFINTHHPQISKQRKKRMVFVAYPSENERWDSRVS